MIRVLRPQRWCHIDAEPHSKGVSLIVAGVVYGLSADAARQVADALHDAADQHEERKKNR